MKPVALILSIGTFFYFLIALGYWDNGGQFAWISPDEVFHAITFPPLSFLAFGLFIYGLVRLVTGKGLRIYYSAVGLFALPLCSLYALDQIKAGRAESRREYAGDWSGKSDALAAILLDYYKLHPNRFHFVGDSEEVTVDGFLEYCESRPDFASLNCPHDSEQLLDFTGRPVHYYVALNDDGHVGPWAVTPDPTSSVRVGIAANSDALAGFAPPQK